MALLHESDVALLDEPAASLDDGGIAVLVRCLTTLRDRGAAALWPAMGAIEPELPLHERRSLLDERLQPRAAG
jgi:energy-coupling factor transporter ATP-binding protein EcfA2